MSAQDIVDKLFAKVSDEELEAATLYVKSLLAPHVYLHRNQELAVVSFVLTSRKGAFARSEFLKRLNVGPDPYAAKELLRPAWSLVNGKRSKSKAAIRKLQYDLFMTPCVVSMQIGGKP